MCFAPSVMPPAQFGDFAARVGVRDRILGDGPNDSIDGPLRLGQRALKGSALAGALARQALAFGAIRRKVALDRARVLELRIERGEIRKRRGRKAD
jgi:hypothetical protein